VTISATRTGRARRRPVRGPRPARRRTLYALIAGALATVLLAACGSSGGQGDWQPAATIGAVPIPNPEQSDPQLAPGPGGSGPSGSGPAGPVPTAPGSSGAAPSGTGAAGGSPVVATNVASPTGLIVMPDGTALVGERATGRILRVQPSAPQGVPQPATQVEQLTNLDASGDGGLLDLALSPTYDQDGLVLAYITTPTDNEVVHFTLGGVATPILTGIPKGPTGNGGRIAFDGAGHLYIATGDAGNPALANDPTSLAGKILRTDDLGRPSPDNPNPASPIWATGPVGTTGLCLDTSSGNVYATTSTPDQVFQLSPGGVYAGAGAAAPLASLPATWPQANGCAVGSNTVYVATGDGKAVVGASLAANPGPLGAFQSVSAVEKTYGRFRTVVYGSDGALWITTDNLPPDGSAPDPTDDRVLRIVDVPSGAGSLA
jgi:glucose/arabinose dehydrogenase